MSKKRTLFLVVGFALFLYGFLAIVLQFIGLQLTFLTWIDKGGQLLGFTLRLIMVIAGIAIAYAANTDWEKENNDSI